MTAFLLFVLLAGLLALPEQVLAQGCAMCRTSLQGQDDPLVQALNTSVIFLMTMPYLIVGSVGGWIYLAVRRQRDTDANANADADADAD